MNKEFNTSQAEAASFKDGACFCIAGPGSGKTTVIIGRVQALVQEAHVPPEHILVVTFTKAAAMEMKTRYLALLGEDKTRVTFSTFHSLFFQILKYAYGYRADNIIREETKYAYLRGLVARLQIPYENETDFIGKLLEEISLVKSKAIPLDHYYAKCCATEKFRELFLLYKQQLGMQRLIDFDDMQCFCYELFSKRPDILEKWQNRYRYLMVDEFQDIDMMQYAILKQLAGERQNVFAVGDDDQSIYHFRGANPEICFRFVREFRNVTTIPLNINYRSTQPIVELSKLLISKNKRRFEKDLQADKKGGERVVFRVYQNQYEETAGIIQEIERIKKAGGSYEQAAVLFRTNRQPGLFAERLMEYNIPFRLKDYIPNMYEHWIAKDILTYLRIAHGSRQRRDFYRIMNRPNRYLSRASLDGTEVAFDVWEDYYEEQDWMCERIGQLEADLRVISRLRPAAAVRYIRETVGYDGFLKEYAVERKLEREELFEMADRLGESAQQFECCEAWFAHMEQYKENLKEKIAKEQSGGQPQGVTLSTLHAAKGLEYDVVFIVDLNEGMIPYKKASLPEEIEEERRLFYVGITRAKERLYLSSVHKILHHEADVSPFIREIGFLKA